jgi:hypothetical protein
VKGNYRSERQREHFLKGTSFARKPHQEQLNSLAGSVACLINFSVSLRLSSSIASLSFFVFLRQSRANKHHGAASYHPEVAGRFRMQTSKLGSNDVRQCPHAIRKARLPLRILHILDWVKLAQKARFDTLFAAKLLTDTLALVKFPVLAKALQIMSETQLSINLNCAEIAPLSLREVARVATLQAQPQVVAGVAVVWLIQLISSRRTVERLDLPVDGQRYS